jgi:nitroreductase
MSERETAETDIVYKPAEAEYPIHPLLQHRWSPRAFADRPVPREVLLSLFEAARWSASCFNEQPWSFIVATSDQPEAFAKLLSCLNESNQAWAKRAPVLALTVTHRFFEVNHSLNRHAWHDIGLAVQNLTLQATASGLIVHQMAGILADHAREVYGIPEDYDVVTAIAIGYQGTLEVLSEKHQTREIQHRTRRPLSQILIGDQWGHTSPLVEEAQKPDEEL